MTQSHAAVDDHHQDVRAALAAAHDALARANDLDELAGARTIHMGKRSALAQVQRVLGGLDPDARRELGAAINAARVELAAAAPPAAPAAWTGTAAIGVAKMAAMPAAAPATSKVFLSADVR